MCWRSETYGFRGALCGVMWQVTGNWSPLSPLLQSMCSEIKAVRAWNNLQAFEVCCPLALATPPPSCHTLLFWLLLSWYIFDTSEVSWLEAGNMYRKISAQRCSRVVSHSQTVGSPFVPCCRKPLGRVEIRALLYSLLLFYIFRKSICVYLGWVGLLFSWMMRNEFELFSDAK